MERSQGGSPGRQSRTRPAYPRHEDVAGPIVRRPLSAGYTVGAARPRVG